MKQLRSNIRELRAIFDLITVKYISEFDLDIAEKDDYSIEIKNRMLEKDYDIVPVTSDNKIIGYVVQSELSEGICIEQMKSILLDDILAESTPILDLLVLFKNRDWFFVLERNEIKGIVTKGDLRKAPIRMFLFALINLLEMHITRLIRYSCNEDELKNRINDGRLKNAYEQLEKLKRKNEAIDIFDCLQFCDKRDISLKENRIYDCIKINGRKETLQSLKKIEDLRDNIAHSNDIISGMTWEEVIDLTVKMENMIGECESNIL